MKQIQTKLMIKTCGQGFYDITRDIQNWVQPHKINTGLITIFIQHTSASLTIQENADPDVQHDLIKALNRLAPESKTLYRHNAEGPDDMPAHIKTAITDVSLNIPVTESRLALGTWQGIYIVEHRKNRHTRRIICHLIGE
jgi:secondary thiamine-phosphate synthase enzyme